MILHVKPKLSLATLNYSNSSKTFSFLRLSIRPPQLHPSIKCHRDKVTTNECMDVLSGAHSTKEEGCGDSSVGEVTDSKMRVPPLSSRAHVQIPSMMVLACDPSAWEVETEGFEVHWPARLAKQVEGNNELSCLKNQNG